MNDETVNKFVVDCDVSYKTQTGKTFAEAAIDPTIIASIITLLFQMCPKPPATLKKEAASGSLSSVMSVRSATRVALREKYPGVIFVYAKYNGDALASAVLKTVANQDEAKMQAVMDTIAI
jgi:hypothetical protein